MKTRSVPARTGTRRRNTSTRSGSTPPCRAREGAHTAQPHIGRLHAFNDDARTMSRPISETAPISDLATFAEALAVTRRTFGPILPYWRGHGNVDWSLTAEVFRTPSHGRSHPEVTLIRNFMGRAESRSHRCPAYDDYVGWLMLARHFCLPTRLLDWSMSPLVALFFAVEHHEEVDGALWALHPALLNQSMIGENRVLILDDPPIQELVKLAFNPDPALHQAAAPRVKGWRRRRRRSRNRCTGHGSARCIYDSCRRHRFGHKANR